MEVTGSGFLYKMVRHLVGALLAVGQGKLTYEQVKEKLDGGAAAGEAGLYVQHSLTSESNYVHGVGMHEGQRWIMSGRHVSGFSACNCTALCSRL